MSPSVSILLFETDLTSFSTGCPKNILPLLAICLLRGPGRDNYLLIANASTSPRDQNVIVTVDIRFEIDQESV
jgi:hypothetical protein